MGQDIGTEYKSQAWLEEAMFEEWRKPNGKVLGATSDTNAFATEPHPSGNGVTSATSEPQTLKKFSDTGKPLPVIQGPR